MNTDRAFGAWRKSTFSNPNGNQCVEVAWRKSSYSGPQGNECVEVAWRKSTFSNPNGNACVEVAHGAQAVGLRDSKNPAGGLLTIPSASWSTFTHTLPH